MPELMRCREAKHIHANKQSVQFMCKTKFMFASRHNRCIFQFCAFFENTCNVLPVCGMKQEPGAQSQAVHVTTTVRHFQPKTSETPVKRVWSRGRTWAARALKAWLPERISRLDFDSNSFDSFDSKSFYSKCAQTCEEIYLLAFVKGNTNTVAYVSKPLVFNPPDPTIRIWKKRTMDNTVELYASSTMPSAGHEDESEEGE